MSRRWAAVDSLRGLVMVVMALDHVRDFFGSARFDATDLAQTTAPIFMSRWITHLCAPAFFLLAGASAYLSIASGRRTPGQAARFLLVRGLALVVVEQTLLRCLGWYFHFDYQFMNGGVLYGLGLAMMITSALVWLSPLASLGLGLAIILGEPLIAKVELGWAFDLLARSRDFEPVDGYHFYVSYPPLPWLGAMLFGYGVAHVAARDTAALAATGLAMLALFAVMRATGVGDPSPAQSGALSFINVSKYPPSTAFLLLTLGIGLVALAAFERWPHADRFLGVYGRVPLFFYLLHIPLIHGLAVAYALLAFGDATWLTSGPVIFWDVPLPGSPPDYGFSLPGVYAIWLAVCAAMYAACLGYARLVSRRTTS